MAVRHRKGVVLVAGKMPNVKITLVDRMGKRGCPNGHQLGESWLCEGPNTPGGLCSNAYVSMYPTIWAMQNGMRPHGENTMRLACQDTNVVNVFELEVLE